MSTVPARRPRRIIEAPVPVQPTPAPPRAAERFQRALLMERRSRGAALPATVAPAAASARAPAAAPAAPPSPGTRPQATAHGMLPLALKRDPAEPRVRHGDAGPRNDAALSDAGEDAWAYQLVHTIVTLCVRADPAMEAWSVTLPMDERTLPQTELRLSLSRHRIALRFHTLSPRSVALLSRHRGSLAALLQQALSQDRDIDIEVT
jgi:hypothetical protein